MRGRHAREDAGDDFQARAFDGRISKEWERRRATHGPTVYRRCVALTAESALRPGWQRVLRITYGICRNRLRGGPCSLKAELAARLQTLLWMLNLFDHATPRGMAQFLTERTTANANS